MIILPVAESLSRAAWEAILDLSLMRPTGWTLIGAQMVALHAYENGRDPPRFSEDVDVIVDVRILRSATEDLAEDLLRSGYAFDGASPEGIGHRFVRGEVRVDVLAPDGLGERARLVTVRPAKTIQVPGGTQALHRTEMIEVRIGDREGVVPRPNLLGAILVKARAVAVDDVPESQRADLVFLLSLVTDPRGLATRMRRSEQSWLRRRKELFDSDHAAWQGVADAEDAQQALRIRLCLAGPCILAA